MSAQVVCRKLSTPASLLRIFTSAVAPIHLGVAPVQCRPRVEGGRRGRGLAVVADRRAGHFHERKEAEDLRILDDRLDHAAQQQVVGELGRLVLGQGHGKSLWGARDVSVPGHHLAPAQAEPGGIQCRFVTNWSPAGR